ncbi:hypothetical protein JB92DRAFT_3025212 [Gautieria morchelliformis]|nr:hypothetical protein JB92DRAFT_3025212 [Gautieria morchelliformis]
MSLKLDTLPDDVLIRVFKELDAYDIHRCSLTCRVFHETIRDSLFFRYRLELTVAGLEDGSTECRLSIAERLALLKTIEQGWANLYFRQKYTISSLPGSLMWKLCGGVLARGYATELSFLQPPSAVQGTDGHAWQSDMEVNIQQFAIDPAQDLAVLVARPETPDEQWHTFLIHLRTMSTGVHHPYAPDPILACIPTLIIPEYRFDIRIMGDFLAVFYHTPAGYLRDLLSIWDWKAGQLLITLEASSLATDIINFSFLSPRHFIIARCTSDPDGCYQPNLDVYDFIAARPEGSMEPRLVCIYQLPRVQRALTRFLLGSELSSELTSSGKSFYPTSCSRLLTVSMGFTDSEQRARSYVLFVHVSSLLAEVDARSNAEQPIVPWESWGPLKTRMLPIYDNRPDWHVYGTRYVWLDDSMWERLRMFDFNPLALRRALSSQGTLSSSEDESEPFSITTVLDSEPTIIGEHESSFTQRVITGLPYRDVIGRRIGDAELLIDRECVVLMGWDAIDDSWQTSTMGVDFLCI